MALSGAQVAVTTTPVKVAEALGSATGDSVVLSMLETSQPVYLDGTNAVDATKFAWYGPQIPALRLDLRPGEQVWAKVASGTTHVSVLQRGT